MGKRVGNDDVFVDFPIDDLSKRMGRGDEGDTPGLPVGRREPADDEKRGSDERQRNKKRQ